MIIELLGLLVLIVILSLAVYIAQLGTKETPFEEALAEQRHSDLGFSPSKSDKTHKKAKVKKVKPKKEVRLQSSKGSKHEIAPVHKPLNPKGKENSPKESKSEEPLNPIKVHKVEEKAKTNFREPKAEGQNNSKKTKEEGQSKSSNKESKLEAPVKGTKEVNEMLKGSKDLKPSQQQKVNKEGKLDSQFKGNKEPKTISPKEHKETSENVKVPSGPKEPSPAKNSPPKPAAAANLKENDTSPKQIERKKKKDVKGDIAEDKAKKDVENMDKKKGVKDVKSDKKKIVEEENVKSPKKKEETKEVKKLDGHALKPQPSEITKFDKKAQSNPTVAGNEGGKRFQSSEDLSSKKQSKGSSAIPDSPKGSSKQDSSPKKAPNQNEASSLVVSQTGNVPMKSEKSKVNSPVKLSKIEKEQMLVVESQMQGNDKKKKREKEERKKLLSLSDDALSRLLPIIQKTQLSSAEIQMLIETLLNKQQLTGGVGGEWIAKGKMDPVMQLKRQLEDAESRLKEKEDAHETLSAKIADLRSDLNTERGRSNTLKKQLDNSCVVLQQKLDVAQAAHKEQLTAQLNELKAALNKEYHAKMISLQQTCQRDSELKLQQVQNSLAEVEKQLQQSQATQQESEAQFQQLKNTLTETQQQLQAAVQEREELINTHQQYQHLAVLKEESDQQIDALNTRLFQVQQQLSASETAQSQAVSQLKQVTEEKNMLHQQINNLENVRELLSQNQVKLKNVIFEKTELENRLSQTEKELDSHRDLVKKQVSEMELLKEEKESLASQSVRPAAEGQENGDVHFESKETNSQIHLSAIREEELSALKKEISKLKEESTHLKRICDDEMERREQLSRTTKAVLRRIFPSLKPGAEGLEHGAFLQEVEAAAASVKAQPPVVEVKKEIVEKIVEKVVQDPNLCQQLEEFKKENAELHKKLDSLAKQKLSLEASLKSSSTADEDKDSQISKLELENKDLAAKIVNYQDILANTESLLKSLQKSVESEESSWHEKLLQKEELVRQLTVEKKNLVLQVSELQTSLDKVKQAEEMESQLNCLKERLSKEEEAKGKIQEDLNKAQELLEAANVVQVSTNGPANGVDCHEDEISQADTTSLVSSEGHSTHTQTDDTNKKKKKKKNFFLKLIGKSTNTETGNVTTVNE